MRDNVGDESGEGKGYGLGAGRGGLSANPRICEVHCRPKDWEGTNGRATCGMRAICMSGTYLRSLHHHSVHLSSVSLK